MQIKNLLSDEQLNSLLTLNVPKKGAHKFAPDVPQPCLAILYEIAEEHLSEEFLKKLNREITVERTVIVRFSEKAYIHPYVKSETFAKYLGLCLKNGDKIVRINTAGWFEVVSWNNWKRFYKSLTTTESANNLPDHPTKKEIAMRRRERETNKIFQIGKECNRISSMHRRGFKLSQRDKDTYRHLNLVEEVLSGVASEAKRIFENT